MMRAQPVVLIALAVIPISLFAQPEFFAIGAPAPSSPGPHGVVAAEFVPNVAAIRRGAEEFQFQLPGGRSVVLKRSRMEERGQGDVFWHGSVVGEQGSEVSLTLYRGILAGAIVSGGETYEIRPERGRQIVEKLNPASFPPCGGGIPAGRDEADGAAPLAVRAEPAADTPVEVHLLSMYTPQARDASGGDNGIKSLIQQAVDRANLALANSNINARYVLVHAALANWNDTGDMSSDLSWLVSDPATASLRNTYGADMVSLIVSNGGSACGLGYVMRSPGPSFAPYAFQVTDRDCAVGNLTFAHEHGHNVGMEHDPANGVAPSSASYPWSFGHYVNGVFRTVMSYSTPCSSGCTRVAYFSNPAVYYNGYPTGIPDQRDNARTANLTMPIVAVFRAPAASSPPAAPSNLAAVAVSSSQVNLTWADNSDNESQFRIERSANGGAFSQVAAVGANVTSFSDTGLAANTLYAYRVRASNGAGDSAYSNTASATTPAGAPAAPSNLTAAAVYTGNGKSKTLVEVKVAWADNSADETGFTVERCKQTGKGGSATCSFSPLAIVGPNISSYSDRNAPLPESGTYKYRVCAKNGAGCSPWSNVAQVNVQ